MAEQAVDTQERLAALVGQRIRRLRLAAGLSVREQARTIGMSASALSDLENNKGGISLTRLQQVARHFGLPVTDLLAEEDAGETGPDGAEIFEAAAASTPGVRRGDGVLQQIIGPGHGHRLQPYLVTLGPSGGYDGDMIGHPGEEFAYVLQGQVELVLGSDVHRLSQGDVVRFGSETPHAFRNASTTGVGVVLGAATPPW